MKPVCFMVMPFRRKPVTQARSEAPREVDCDRLWDAALRPALEELGYLPVRADVDPGAVIVKDMLNRLKHADLVLADISLPNGNVYYELGIHHVTKDSRCVVIAADWFQPLFDVDYVRTIVYPMPQTSITDDQAAAIRQVLLEQIPRYQETRTPYYELVDESAEQAFKESAEQLGAFQAEIRTVRLLRSREERRDQVDQLVEKHLETARLKSEVALELLYLVRDTLNWQAVREFVEKLPEQARKGETLREQYFLALSELGEHEQAISGLEQINRRFGETPERCGIIGGRYKRLYRDARSEREQAGEPRPSPAERRYLKEAISSYDQGTMLDLNEYYCACNLPALLRARQARRPRARRRHRRSGDHSLPPCRKAQQYRRVAAGHTVRHGLSPRRPRQPGGHRRGHRGRRAVAPGEHLEGCRGLDPRCTRGPAR